MNNYSIISDTSVLSKFSTEVIKKQLFLAERQEMDYTRFSLMNPEKNGILTYLIKTKDVKLVAEVREKEGLI